jgi:DNA-binding CsgD family transcriptional regulator
MEQVIIRKKNDIAITERDVKIVQLIADGLRAAEIGKKLRVSPRTVEFHVNKLKDKFSAKSQPHLAVLFFRRGLIK